MDRLIAEQKLDLTEDEYALLLGVCAAEGARWEAAAQLLARMSRELTALQPATLAAAEALFRCAYHLSQPFGDDHMLCILQLAAVHPKSTIELPALLSAPADICWHAVPPSRMHTMGDWMGLPACNTAAL